MENKVALMVASVYNSLKSIGLVTEWSVEHPGKIAGVPIHILPARWMQENYYGSTMMVVDKEVADEIITRRRQFVESLRFKSKLRKDKRLAWYKDNGLQAP